MDVSTHKRTCSQGEPERVNRFGTKHGENLTDEVMVLKLWTTPTVQDGENTAGPSQLNRNSIPLNAAFGSGSLHPRFVEQLMGFEIDHTDLKHSETHASRSKPIRSSRQSPR